MFPPAARCCATLSNTDSFWVVSLSGVSLRRTIGTAPARSSSQRKPGIDHSVDFATGEISQAASVNTRIGSISAFV